MKGAMTVISTIQFIVFAIGVAFCDGNDSLNIDIRMWPTKAAVSGETDYEVVAKILFKNVSQSNEELNSSIVKIDGSVVGRGSYENSPGYDGYFYSDTFRFSEGQRLKVEIEIPRHEPVLETIVVPASVKDFDVQYSKESNRANLDWQKIDGINYYSPSVDCFDSEGIQINGHRNVVYVDGAGLQTYYFTNQIKLNDRKMFPSVVFYIFTDSVIREQRDRMEILLMVSGTFYEKKKVVLVGNEQ